MDFCTVVGCMDGRVQGPAMAFVAAHYGYDCQVTALYVNDRWQCEVLDVKTV
jgi:hypothetical protein